MKIKSITISGMHNIIGMPKTYNFKDINYLVGRNGAGKSTVLQAIQLAVLGYIPGTDKRVSEIFNHCSGKSMSVDLKLTNDNHVDEDSEECARVVRSWSLKGRSIQHNVTTIPEDFDVSSLASQIELPIFNFNEFLSLSKNQLKNWFLNFLPEPNCKINWEEEFTVALMNSGFVLADSKYLDELIAECAEGTSGLSSVQNTHANLKEMQAAKKIDVARLEGAVQALIFYDDVSSENYEETKAEIQRRLEEIKCFRKSATEVAQKVYSNQELKQKIKSYSERLIPEDQLAEYESILSSNLTRKAEITSDYEKTKTELESTITALAALQSDINAKQQIIAKKGICPYTQSQCESIVNYIEQLKRDVEAAQIEMNRYREVEKSYREQLASKSAELLAFSSEVERIKHLVDGNNFATAQLSELESQIQQVSDNDLKFLEISTSDLDVEEDELRKTLVKLEANHVYEEKINALTLDKYKAENELEALKILIKHTDANNMQTAIAESPFAQFVDSMNAILPSVFGDDVKFKVNLESRANSFSLGIVKHNALGDMYIPYDLMSSGEKTLLAFALMIYIAQQSSNLKVVIIDDMLDHLDDENFVSLFNACFDSNVQVINAGVKPINISNMNIINI